MLIKKILFIVLAVFIVILSALFALFYRSDLSLEDLKERYLTDDSHMVDVNILSLDGEILEINIHYVDMGDENDPVIVLLHGAFASSHTFIPWAHDLVEAGYRVIAIDLPYHGLSDGFDDQVTSLRRSAAVVYALLDYLFIDTIIIGGNSMGGGVSWYFTSTYLEEITIKGLVLIDAVHPETTGGGPRSSFLSTPWIASIISKMTPRFLLKQILQGVYGDEGILLDETVTRYYELILKEGFRYGLLTNTQETLDLDGILEPIKENNIPTLIMWGRQDTWVPLEVSTLFIRDLSIPNDHIIIYDGLGHVPMEEDPGLTIIDLLIFINQLS